MGLLDSYLAAEPTHRTSLAGDPSTVIIAVIGAVVGVIGLFLSWSSGRAERTAKRLEQLIAMDADARSRGPLASDDLRAVEQHRAFVAQLDEEIRLHQQFAFQAARRTGSATSSAAVLGWALYGAFLIAAGLHIASVDRPVSNLVAGLSWILALGGVTCVVRSGVLAAHRVRIWDARRRTGIEDLYSLRTLVRLRQAIRRERAS